MTNFLNVEYKTCIFHSHPTSTSARTIGIWGWLFEDAFNSERTILNVESNPKSFPTFILNSENSWCMNILDLITLAHCIWTGISCLQSLQNAAACALLTWRENKTKKLGFFQNTKPQIYFYFIFKALHKWTRSSVKVLWECYCVLLTLNRHVHTRKIDFECLFRLVSACNW